MDNLIKAFALDKLILDENNNLPAALDCFPLAIYATNRDGDIIYYNMAALKTWGRRPIKGRDKWCAHYDLYTVNGQFIPKDECAMAHAAKYGKTLRGVEAVAVRPNGSAFRFLPFPTPLYNDKGELVGAVNMIVHLCEIEMALPETLIDFHPAHDDADHASASSLVPAE